MEHLHGSPLRPTQLAPGGYRLFVNHRLAPVVAEGLMASRRALSACFRFIESYWKLPGRKRHAVTNVFWVVRGMSVVTRPACASLYHFVDMDEMQVLVSVSEICQRCGPFVIGNAFLMAHETELIVVLVIGGVEELREKLAQYPEIPGPVSVVTARAIVLLNGTVTYGVVRQDLFHVRYTAILAVILPVVATQAEFSRLFYQLLSIIGGMGIMAAKALPARIKPLVGDGCLLDLLFLVLMAGIAKIARAIRS
jgi:hypothetical protein